MDAVALLRELVRIPSVDPSPEGEGHVAEALRVPLDAAGLETRILRSPEGRPSLVARLAGPTDRAPLVLLSHTDVVPVERERWEHDPFGAEVVDGHLWGRGTLDMKGVAVMHAAAVVALAQGGREVGREVVLVAVADEEAGGAQGAGWLVRERGADVGFREACPAPEVLGEGGFGLSGILGRPLMPIVVGEKAPLRVRAEAAGGAGHGSLPPDRQAIRALTRFVEAVAGPGRARIHPVMREQLNILADASNGTHRAVLGVLAGPLGDVAVRAFAPRLRSRAGAIAHLLADSCTPTSLEAGYAGNVVPGRARAGFDLRLLPDSDPDAVLTRLRRVGHRYGVRIEEVSRWQGPTSPRTPLFALLEDVSSGLSSRPVVVPSLTPGTTDLRYFRARGAVAYGWVPLVLTPELLATFHGDDERVEVSAFLEAVSAMILVVGRAGTGEELTPW